MGKFDGVLLVSDICDTLVDTADGPYVKGKNGEERELVPVLEQDRRALEHFTAEGGKFTIATGRSLKYVQYYADRVPINVPGVLGDGSAICDVRTGAYLETAVLDEGVRELGQAVLDRFPTTTVTARHIDGMYYTARPDSLARLIMSVGEDMLEISSLLEVPLPIQRMWFRDQNRTLNEVRDFLRAQGCGSEQYDLTFTSEGQVEMGAVGSGKGTMVCRLAERLGVSMEHVYCVGNGKDDVSMLTAAKQGFAPSGCDQAVQDCGAKIVRQVNMGALAEVVEILDGYY